MEADIELAIELAPDYITAGTNMDRSKYLVYYLIALLKPEQQEEVLKWLEK